MNVTHKNWSAAYGQEIDTPFGKLRGDGALDDQFQKNLDSVLKDEKDYSFVMKGDVDFNPANSSYLSYNPTRRYSYPEKESFFVHDIQDKRVLQLMRPWPLARTPNGWDHSGERFSPPFTRYYSPGVTEKGNEWFTWGGRTQQYIDIKGGKRHGSISLSTNLEQFGKPGVHVTHTIVAPISHGKIVKEKIHEELSVTEVSFP